MGERGRGSGDHAPVCPVAACDVGSSSTRMLTKAEVMAKGEG